MRPWLTTLLLLIALPLAAADLRDITDPAKIGSSFPPAAKLRVVNVWATWCAPCVAELPDLEAVRTALGGNVSLVGVSMDDMLPDAKREAVLSFLYQHKISYMNLYYKGKAEGLESRLHFGGEIPFTIVFDRSGKEVWRHQGRIDRNRMIAELRALLRRSS